MSIANKTLAPGSGPRQKKEHTSWSCEKNSLAHSDGRGGGQNRRLMSLSPPFIHRPVATVLLTAAIALAGAVAFTVLPVSPLPQIDFPTITVAAALPGAS